MQLEVITKKPESPSHSTPLLFVHGMWLGAWAREEHYLPYFAEQGYEAHAVSLRGHGKSDGQKGLTWTPLSKFVDDMASIVNDLEQPPVLVGHSMGGIIVQKYLETHETPAAVLVGSAPPNGLFGATLRILRHHPLIFCWLNLTLDVRHLISTPDRCRKFLFNEKTSEAKLEKYFDRIKNQGGSYRAFTDMMLFNLPVPQKVTTPLLVLGAQNDSSILPHEVEATARAYHTKAKFFPDTGHEMMLEDSWKAQADYILDWLKEKGL